MAVIDQHTWDRAAAICSRWNRPLLLSHVKPDGDALGALAAMRCLLNARGADALALLFDQLPGRYVVMERYGPMPVWGRDVRDADLAGVDGVLILDTCTYNQLEPIAEWLRALRRSGHRPDGTPVNILAVDHHVTRDDLADDYLIDESAAATCLILQELAKAEGWPLPTEAREALFIGLATDTGWFQHSNTDARVLSATTELVEQGVVAHEIHRQLYQKETPGRIRLLGAALETLELLAGDRLAVMTLSTEVFARCGARPADTEDIVNEPLRIESVAVSAFLVEEGQRVRVSFRSKSPTVRVSERLTARRPSPVDGVPHAAPPRLVQAPHSSPLASGEGRDRGCPPTGSPRAEVGESSSEAMPDIDVARIAQSFGGGGHPRAAGARIVGSLGTVRPLVIEHLVSVLSRRATPAR